MSESWEKLLTDERTTTTDRPTDRPNERTNEQKNDQPTDRTDERTNTGEIIVPSQWKP